MINDNTFYRGKKMRNYSREELYKIIEEKNNMLIQEICGEPITVLNILANS